MYDSELRAYLEIMLKFLHNIITYNCMYFFSTHTWVTPKFNFVSTKLKGTTFFFHLYSILIRLGKK